MDGFAIIPIFPTVFKSSQLFDYITRNKFQCIVFDRESHHGNFADRLFAAFPTLSNFFITENGRATPIFPRLVKFTLSRRTLGGGEGNAIFQVQSVMGDKFLLVDTADEKLKEGHDIRDIVISESYQDILSLNKWLQTRLNPKTERSFIYTWNSDYSHWERDRRRMYNKSIDDLIGLDEIFNQIQKDIFTYKRNKTQLIRLGESNGLNYMFYGAPGTGKSSLVRALAMKHEMPVYVAKMTAAKNENQITEMLIPEPSNTRSDDENELPDDAVSRDVTSLRDFKIVLLEDVDRYLGTTKNNSTMSAILNALDGIYPSFGVIRIFSANNPESLAKNKAFTTRLNKAFYFAPPTANQMERQVYNAFQGKIVDSHKLAIFLDFIKDKDISMRQLTHFLCQHLDSENPMTDVLATMDQWINDMVAFSFCKDTDVNPNDSSSAEDDSSKSAIVEDDTPGHGDDGCSGHEE